VLDDRGDVRAHEVLAVAKADHERGVTARCNDPAGILGVHCDQRERPLEP
jgi:hypothetical protein